MTGAHVIVCAMTVSVLGFLIRMEKANFLLLLIVVSSVTQKK
jgi:hypothetical protein